MKLKTKSTACAMLAILLVSTAQTGCVTASRDAADSRRLYQPRVLRLPAGQPVQTTDGQHVPQVAEIWHSDAAFRDLEARYLDAIGADVAREHLPARTTAPAAQ